MESLVGAMRILVVDDDPSVAEVIAGAVRAAGHEALVALDGTEALDVLQATPVDGVFLDLVMPGLGGLVVLRRLRSEHPQLPVVILSAYAGEEQVEEALALGAQEVVLKPTALAQMTAVLERLARH
jgi:CheY-like chemotaxis protein